MVREECIYYLIKSELTTCTGGVFFEETTEDGKFIGSNGLFTLSIPCRSSYSLLHCLCDHNLLGTVDHLRL
jgi:hypothetical protein